MDVNRSRPDILSTALGAVPLVRGKYRLVSAIAVARARWGSHWGYCSVGTGATIRVDLNDRIQQLMWGHCYENHIQKCFSALLSPGSVYLDVGAHIGYHAVLAASIVGPTGQVYAFEADPTNFERLQEQLHVFGWATAINKAAWITTGLVVFERSSQTGESGWGTVAEVRDLKKGEYVSVSAISLDDWAVENNVERVSVVKVDAEGSEVSIFRGARDFLNRTKATVITEVNNTLLLQGERSSDELIDILRNYGYELFHMNGKIMQKLGATGAPQFCEVLCVHYSQQTEVLQRLRRRGFRIELRSNEAAGGRIGR
jgi:FkbM family methyltransferase